MSRAQLFPSHLSTAVMMLLHAYENKQLHTRTVLEQEVHSAVWPTCYSAVGLSIAIFVRELTTSVRNFPSLFVCPSNSLLLYSLRHNTIGVALKHCWHFHLTVRWLLYFFFFLIAYSTCSHAPTFSWERIQTRLHKYTQINARVDVRKHKTDINTQINTTPTQTMDSSDITCSVRRRCFLNFLI